MSEKKIRFDEVIMRSMVFAIVFLVLKGLFLPYHAHARGTGELELSRTRGEASRPNIVLIMVDDLGFSDIGCYGGEIETPNLDRLAKQGIRLSQFYNCAKCETTRSTLLSGRYYGEVANQKLENCITLAEGLKQGGYRTFMVGKWHLQNSPMDRGFD